MAHFKRITILFAVAFAIIEANTIPQPTNEEEVDHNEPANTASDSDEIALVKVGNFTEGVGLKQSSPPMKFSMCSIASDYSSFDEIGSCYKVHDRSLTFLEAMMKCRVEGAELAIINSEAEANVLKMLKGNDPNTKNINVYIGALKVIENWITLQGQTLSKAGYSSWAFAEPNNDGGHENCAEIEANGKLNDVPCDTLRPYICEQKM